MIEFLINVALASASPVIVLLVVGIFAYYLMRKDKRVFKVTGIAILLTLIYNATLPSNTYKHEPFDKVKEDKRVEHILNKEQDRPRVIKDMTKPLNIMSEEDFKTKVNYEEEL